MWHWCQLPAAALPRGLRCFERTGAGGSYVDEHTGAYWYEVESSCKQTRPAYQDLTGVTCVARMLQQAL